MSFLTRNLRQTATYWPPSTPDGFGGKSFGTRQSVKCRWEDKAEKFVDTSGEEVVSEAIVYLAVDVVQKGWLFLGTSGSTDPTTVSGAHEIRAFRKSPSLKATLFERKVWI